MRLHKLGLLPAAVLRADGEGADAAAQRMPKPTLPPRSGSSAMLYRAFTRWQRFVTPEPWLGQAAPGRTACARSRQGSTLLQRCAYEGTKKGHCLSSSIRCRLW